MFRFGQPEGGIIQTAFITGDIYKSMREMTELLKVGPWFLFENFELRDLHYRGEPADFEVTLALGNCGHMQFELILPLDEKPSVYREVREKKGWGFHHYGIGVTRFDDACRFYAERGFEQVLSGVAGVGARAAYYDTRDPVYGMVELIEVTETVETLWDTIRAAAVDWDGWNPVRTF